MASKSRQCPGITILLEKIIHGEFWLQQLLLHEVLEGAFLRTCWLPSPTPPHPTQSRPVLAANLLGFAVLQAMLAPLTFTPPVEAQLCSVTSDCHD